MIIAAVALAGVLSAPPALPGPHFVADSTRAVVRDGAVVVSFEEAGLRPHGSVEVHVAVDVTKVSACVTDGPSPRTVFTTTSSASARAINTYTADAKGTVVGSRRLVAQAGTVEVSGLGCEMRTTTTFVVTLSDRTNNVTYVVPSPGR